ncbi:DNA sulfur modification protein DndB [Crossiella cryophila]|uniref:Uncharacterized protein n=1 Tax=Crossiella cryophila TaxID=43355 RepID=A0A7W7FR12_9PSEU|nr:DNA sulfur modification protein DndB [Crossiella cryophila]MBB4674405.1 hypothetical protein [Crossiella cryophila]
MAAMHEGVPVHLMLFRDQAAIGVMSWGTLLTLVPDPILEETKGALRFDRRLREHAELRATVQRLLKGTQKGRNVASYASYIAAGIRGDLGKAWSTPPLCLWSSRPLRIAGEDSEEPGLGRPVVASLPLGNPVIAIDAETQVAAMHKIMNDPDAFDLDDSELTDMAVPYELYWGISSEEARQIFHDRNLFGVPVAKTLALSMDQRDFGTTVAQHAMAMTRVQVDGKLVDFAKYVNTKKRQLAKTDEEWVTLSALRSLAATVMLGKPGIEETSGTIDSSRIPNFQSTEVRDQVAATVSLIISTFSDEFSRRTAITTPAVLAGVGAAAHTTMPWSADEAPMKREEFVSILKDIRWDREPQYWEGVAAKRTAKGDLSFAGGAKDSGHRVCDAILRPDSPLGLRIRGK